MSSIQEYEVKVNNINEKLNLLINKIEDNIEITINYKDVEFSNTIDIKEDTSANIDDKGMGIDNISSFIQYSLENDNTKVDFIYDEECEIVAFEVNFNINMNNFSFGYSINLDGNQLLIDSVLKSIKIA